MQPLTQRLNRPCLLFQSFCEIGQLLDLMAVNRLEQRLARREMTVKGANSHTRRSRDSFEAPPPPAVPATPSGLAPGPPPLNTALAASSRRSRFRSASARGFRERLSSNVFLPHVFLSTNVSSGVFCRWHALKSGGYLRISRSATLTTYHCRVQRRHTAAEWPSCGPAGNS